MFGRNKIAQLAAEFLGTGVLTLLVLSIQRSSIGVAYFIGSAAGLTLVLMALAFGNVSGAHFNPAITVGMWTTRQISSLKAVMYIAMQLLGAWAAYYLYVYFVNKSFTDIGGHYTGRVMVAEAVGTFIFAIGFAAAVFNRVTNAKFAATIGLGMMLGVVAASGASLGLINPAVAVGARAWDVFGTMGWGTYVLGPVLGSVIGFNLYSLLFAPTNALKSARAGAVVTAPVIVETTEIIEEVVPADENTVKPRTTKSAARTGRSSATTARKRTTAKSGTAKRRSTSKRK